MDSNKPPEHGTKDWTCNYNNKGLEMIIEVYVGDIIFGSDDDMMSHKFSKDM
jgi:hypothetical protein